MSFLLKNKASLGDAILKGTLNPTTASHFTYQQSESRTYTCTAVASQVTTIGIWLYAMGQEAANLYGWPLQPGAPVVFTQAWVTTQTDTVTALVAQINAYELEDGSTLGDWLSITPSTNTFTVTTGSNYGLGLTVVNLVHLTEVVNAKGLDLLTYKGDAILLGGVTGASASYLETGGTPTSSVGMPVAEDGNFDIVGVANIINAKIIDSSGASTVNYQIYVG